MLQRASVTQTFGTICVSIQQTFEESLLYVILMILSLNNSCNWKTKQAGSLSSEYYHCPWVGVLFVMCSGTSSCCLRFPPATFRRSSSFDFLSMPHQKWGDPIAVRPGRDPASAQKWNLTHVHMTAIRRHTYRKQDLTIGGMCPRCPRETVDEILKQLESALLLSQLPFFPSQLSWSSSHLAWVSFSLFF